MNRTLRFECVRNYDEAKKVWELLSYRSTIYDEWEFRNCYYQYFTYPLEFYVGYDQDTIVGLLPLQYNTDAQYLEFFGGSAHNDNRIFVKPGYEGSIKQFYNQIDKPAQLLYIDGADVFTQTLPVMDYQYTLPLTELANGEQYLEQYFQGKDARELRRKLKLVQQHNIAIVLNCFEDIESLFTLNIKRFGKDSTFLLPYRKESFKDLLKLPFTPTLLSYVMDNELLAVSFALLYNNHFVSLNSGVTRQGPKHLDVFVRFKRIDYAIRAGLAYYDALSSDCGWKESWHLQKIPQYKFEK
jgi:hypothetical protein